MPVRYLQPSELKRDAALMALVTLPVSWASNRALVSAGLHSMAVRWALSVIVIYFTYLGLLRLWAAGMGEVKMLGHLDRPGPLPSSPRPRPLDLPFDLGFELGDGLLSGLLFGIAAIGVAGLAVWTGGIAWLAAEFALEWLASCALAACLVHRTKEPWTLALVNRTWAPAALAMLVAVISGTLIQGACPAASTLRQAAACLR